jgi:hypothetical protein
MSSLARVLAISSLASSVAAAFCSAMIAGSNQAWPV